MLKMTKENIIYIETERLKVCENEDRYEELEALFGDEQTMRYYPQFLSGAKAGIRQFMGLLNNAGVNVYPFILKETERVAGCITLNNIEETCKRIEVGYFLISSCWKKGYAREILNALVAFLKKHGWHRIEATVYSGNEASQRVLEDCGFTLEGVLRDKYIIRGRYHDDIIYSMIESAN